MPTVLESQMQGSRTLYNLDLDDIIVFPDIQHTPVFPPKPGESWYIITEIVQDRSLGRPVYRVQDKLAGNYWTVAFYTPNPNEDARGCRPGALICIKNGQPHHFLDGQVGYRIEDPSTVIVLPVSMKELRTLNQMLRDRYDDGLLSACVACDRPSKTGCSRCKTRYCSKECQRADWPLGHKQHCLALKTLHEWNRTDWG